MMILENPSKLWIASGDDKFFLMIRIRMSITRSVKDNVVQGKCMIWQTPSTINSYTTLRGNLNV